MNKRKYIVEILEHEYSEWNETFEFDDFEKALTYCKELNFQGHEFSLSAFIDYDEEKESEMNIDEIIKGLDRSIYPYFNETDVSIAAVKSAMLQQKAEIERLNANMDAMMKEHKRLIFDAKTEIIRKFVEKLMKMSEYGTINISPSQLDNIAIEIIGDQN